MEITEIHSVSYGFYPGVVEYYDNSAQYVYEYSRAMLIMSMKQNKRAILLQRATKSIKLRAS